MMRVKKGAAYRIALAVALLFLSNAAGNAQEGGIFWFKDLAKASEAAAKTNQPMMIDFWADWCAPCKIMDAEVYSDAALVAAMSQKVVAVRIHFDLQPEMTRKYSVPALPYLVFTNSYGTELMHHRGFLEASDLTAVVEALPGEVAEINRLDRILQEDKNHFESLAAMGQELRAAGFFGSSNEYYARALKQGEARKNPAQRESALQEMGLNFLELQDGKQAAGSFERGLKEFPRSERRAELLLGLGQAYALSEKKDQARKTLETLLKEFGQSPAAQKARELLGIWK